MKYKIIVLVLTVTTFSCRSKEEKESLARGREVYITHCISCHRDTGEGVPGTYPSLIKPDRIVTAHTQRAIILIKEGSGHENGMRSISVNDKEIADVLNYVQNSWDNKADFILESQIDSIKNQ
ncbi:c-type cytochrome [Ulvibacterium sp.]|uniref:c-type cytochrome n=1 Tax=Ulvibacterium sp. TaxID=2665914 RepID=UPI003BA98437